MDYLQLRDISKKFKKRPVLRGVSLDIMQGQVTGILGPNGAGKTTLFYSIVGLNKVDGGTIYLNDKDITRLPIYERARLGIGYLPQESSVFRTLNVADNIKAVLETINIDKHDIENECRRLLELFHIQHLATSSVLTLSGGERRRLEIARAMAIKPKFMLLDEPFAGVDPIAVQDIRKLITDLVNANIGVLITDHNVRETLKIVDKAYIIYEGGILDSGTAEYLVNAPHVREIYLGDDIHPQEILG